MHENQLFHLSQISYQVIGLCEVTNVSLCCCNPLDVDGEALFSVSAVYLCFSLSAFISSTVEARYVLSKK